MHIGTKEKINQFLRIFGFQVMKSQSLKSKVKRGEYKWLQRSEIKTVLDIGANIGQFALMINEILPDAQIYSFEPIEDCYNNLKRKCRNINNFKAYHFAVGSENKESIINKNEFSASSSIFEMSKLHKEAFPETKNSSFEKITIKTLDSVTNELDLKKNVLAKFDVQGFELEALKGAASIINEIEMIIIETSYFELYKNQPLFNDIYQYLICRDFQFIGMFHQLQNPSDYQFLQGDAIFKRK